MPGSPLEELLLLQIRAARLPLPEREFRFHGTRRWRADFAYPEHKILIEAEGGVFSGGRHTRGKGFEDDCEKCTEAALLGFCVVRVTGGMIKSGLALQFIRRALEAKNQ